ncbi:ComF family protein [soil metagenome]
MLTYLSGEGRNAMLRRVGMAALDALYPPRCLTCTAATDRARGLCPACWSDTHFIAGAACWTCGAPLVGEAGPGDLCETCLAHPPAWDRGAAAILYQGAGRRAVLALKHCDRLDTVRPLAGWMAAVGRELLASADLVAPVPLHWRRLVRRRYNQSAELARALGAGAGRPVAVDLLRRVRMTRPQERMDRAMRHANQEGALEVRARHGARIGGKRVLIIDDVLTSGATLSAAAEACRAAGAARVEVLVLARVVFPETAWSDPASWRREEGEAP